MKGWIETRIRISVPRWRAQDAFGLGRSRYRSPVWNRARCTLRSISCIWVFWVMEKRKWKSRGRGRGRERAREWFDEWKQPFEERTLPTGLRDEWRGVLSYEGKSQRHDSILDHCETSSMIPTTSFFPFPLLRPCCTFLAALILSSKFSQDKCYLNHAWERLSGLPPCEIGRCEVLGSTWPLIGVSGLVSKHWSCLLGCCLFLHRCMDSERMLHHKPSGP